MANTNNESINLDLSTSDFFEEKFSLLKFTDSLTPKYLIDGDILNSEFNFLEFQNGLDTTLAQLKKLKKQTDTQINELETDLFSKEQKFKEELKNFDNRLSDIFSCFRSLDQRISQIVYTSVRTGDKLELLDQQKRNTFHGKEIIRQFLMCNDEKQNDRFLLDKLKQDNGTYLNDYESAEIIQELHKICNDLQIEEIDVAKACIFNKSAELEKRLLSEYDQSLVLKEINKLKITSQILMKFDHCSVVKRHIFHAISQIKPYTSYQVQDIDMFGDSLSQFYDDILSVQKEQCSEMSEIFPNNPNIIKMFLERIFEEKILAFIDYSLELQKRTNSEFLNILETTYLKTCNLIVQLKNEISELDNKEFRMALMDYNFDDVMDTALLSRYRKEYFDKEMLDYKNRIRIEIGKCLNKNIFTNLNSSETLKSSKTSIGSNQGNDNENINTERLFEKQYNISDNFIKLKSLKTSNTWKRSNKADFENQKQFILQILEDNLIQRLISQNNIVLKRCNHFSNPNDLALNVRQLFLYFLKTYFRDFIYNVLEVSEQFLPNLEPKNEPDLFFLQIFSFFNKFIFSIEKHYNLNVISNLVSNNREQELLTAEIKELFRKLEERLLNDLTRFLNSSIYYCGRLLQAEQRKSDFKPRDDSVLPDCDNSAASMACTKVTEFIEKIRKCAYTCFDGRNLDRFLTVLGFKFYDTLISHIQRFSISNSGALLLLRDINVYIKCFRTFCLPSLDAKFDLLRNLVNILSTPNQHLATLFAGDNRFFKDITAEEIRAFLKIRSDYKNGKFEWLFVQKSQD